MLGNVTGLVKSQLTTPWRLLDLPVITEAPVVGIEKSLDTITIRLMIGGRPSRIVLDKNNRTIFFQGTAWNDLTRESRFGTDELVPLVLSTPGVIATAPLLIANSLFWRANAKLFRMNRHLLSIWCRIRHQLDKETQDYLFEALTNGNCRPRRSIQNEL